jgi:hypothetical protein
LQADFVSNPLLTQLTGKKYTKMIMLFSTFVHLGRIHQSFVGALTGIACLITFGLLLDIGKRIEN